MTFEDFLVSIANTYWRPKPSRPRGGDLLLGTTTVHNRVEDVILREEERPTHLAVIGKTGVGKSYLLENLIRQDIHHGTGLVVFDVHGDLADNVLAYLALRARASPDIRERIVLVEPFDETHTVGFNPLERTPHTSPFLQAQGLTHILRTRWEAKSFGPRTEELLRASLYTLSATNLTLLELPRLLTDSVFRDRLIRGVRDAAVEDYWEGRVNSLSERMRAVIREPILTRVSAFLADPQVREVVAQQKSTFTFDDAIQRGLWVVVNLSKGRLGYDNSVILGSLLFTKLELDIMALARIPPQNRKLFAVYADEMQNLAGPNFATLIAEARKYRIALTAGHQYWQQLAPQMRAALLAVGSRVVFRLNHHDAQLLAGELNPKSKDRWASLIPTLELGKALVRTGSARTVELTVTAHENANVPPDEIEQLRAACRRRYAVSRDRIRQDIKKRLERYSARDVARLREQSEYTDAQQPSASYETH